MTMRGRPGSPARGVGRPLWRRSLRARGHPPHGAPTRLCSGGPTARGPRPDAHYGRECNDPPGGRGGRRSERAQNRQLSWRDGVMVAAGAAARVDATPAGAPRPGAGGGRRTRLDQGTLLAAAFRRHPHADQARWGVRVWPEAREVVLFRAPAGERWDPIYLDPQLPGLGVEFVRPVEDVQALRERAARRARSKVRRYVVANA